MIHVVKLGGSLLDLPDLVTRFQAWRPQRDDVALVVGGGDAADLVRGFDQRFNLGDQRGHWLAVRAMQFNTHVVAAALPGSRLSASPDDCANAWREGAMAIIDPLAWLEAQERAGHGVPHRWSFTSDSIAAHVAVVLGAGRLTLLKSTLPGMARTVSEAAHAGVVDSDFESGSAALPHVELVNLREQPPATLRLR